MPHGLSIAASTVQIALAIRSPRWQWRRTLAFRVAMWILPSTKSCVRLTSPRRPTSLATIPSAPRFPPSFPLACMTRCVGKGGEYDFLCTQRGRGLLCLLSRTALPNQCHFAHPTTVPLGDDVLCRHVVCFDANLDRKVQPRGFSFPRRLDSFNMMHFGACTRVNAMQWSSSECTADSFVMTTFNDSSCSVSATVLTFPFHECVGQVLGSSTSFPLGSCLPVAGTSSFGVFPPPRARHLAGFVRTVRACRCYFAGRTKWAAQPALCTAAAVLADRLLRLDEH